MEMEIKSGEYYTVTANSKNWNWNKPFDEKTQAENYLKNTKDGDYNDTVTQVDRDSLILNIHHYPPAPEVSGYDEEQTLLIQAKVVESLAEEVKSFGWVHYNWSDRIIEKNGTKYAVFGNSARMLLPFERISDEQEESVYEYKPVFIDGKMFQEIPDEGKSGVLYLMRNIKRKGKITEQPEWMATFLSACMYCELDTLESPSILPNTQASVLQAMGLNPVQLGGKVVDGEVFKPDADPSSRGSCNTCGEPGVWISGAGSHLCAKHQDDY